MMKEISMENLGDRKIFDGLVFWRNVMEVGKFANNIFQKQMIKP